MLSFLIHGILAGVQQPMIEDLPMEDPPMEDPPMEDPPMEDPTMEGPLEEYNLQNAECKDIDENCPVYVDMGLNLCELAYLKINCKKSCKICS